MKVKAAVNIHNRFDIVVKDAKTGEVIQRGQAENIVLNRMYDRLLAFNNYFVNIVYGKGDGTLSPNGTTLFDRAGYKAAENVELIRAYPTSKWTRKITLGTGDANGITLTEVGISETTTNINTHAKITDAENNALNIEKTELKVVDIYATVFVEIYNVDTGLYWFDNGLRDYLTGGNAPNNNMGISLSGFPVTNVAGTKTVNPNDRTITNDVKFDTQHYNKEIAYLDWTGIGLRCKVPRPGVFEGKQRNDVVIGTGDGENKIFTLPQKYIENLGMMINGVLNEDWTRAPNSDTVIFDDAPPADSVVTASFFCKFYPKDINHILKATMKIGFGIGQPSPVVPAPGFPSIYTGLPGSEVPLGGDDFYGFYGEVSAEDLISGDELCSRINLTAGTSQFSDAGWFKYLHEGKLLYVAKKTIRYNVSWNHINTAGAVFGEAILIIDGKNYMVRLLSSDEWDALIQPVHKDGISPRWGNYGDTDIQVNYAVSGNGCYTWTSTASGSYRVIRGYDSVLDSYTSTPSDARTRSGFRPVLEFIS